MRIGPWDGTNGTLDSIKPAFNKQFLAGQDNDDGTFLITRVNLTALDGSALINLEDFASSFASSVTCGSGTIGITFNDSAAAITALTSWLPGMGIITSGADLCGNDTKRSYYKLLASVTLPVGSNTTILAVQPAAISDVAQRVTIDYGTLQPNTVSQIAPELGTNIAPAWDAIVGYFARLNATNGHDKRCCDISTKVSSSVRIDTSRWSGWASDDWKLPLSVLGLDENTFALHCRDCGLYGTLSIVGGFDVRTALPTLLRHSSDVFEVLADHGID
jgi:hypothetical protein